MSESYRYRWSYFKARIHSSINYKNSVPKNDWWISDKIIPFNNKNIRYGQRIHTHTVQAYGYTMNFPGLVGSEERQIKIFILYQYSTTLWESHWERVPGKVRVRVEQIGHKIEIIQMYGYMNKQKKKLSKTECILNEKCTQHCFKEVYAHI